MVDADPSARRRLQAQLRTLRTAFPLGQVLEAADGARALGLAARHRIDVVLFGVALPDCSGIDLACRLAENARPPRFIAITPLAADEHAAADLERVPALADVLRMPVRTERLEEALRRALDPPAVDAVTVDDQGQARAIPIGEVLYFKADAKYVLLRTRQREFLTRYTLAQLAEVHGGDFVRVHRGVLVARDAIAGASRSTGDTDGWELRLHGVPERLPVSRRLWTDVRRWVPGGGTAA